MGTSFLITILLHTIKSCIGPANLLVKILYSLRLKNFTKNQYVLLNKFKLTSFDQIHEFDEFTKNQIEEASKKYKYPDFIFTSGSTNQPKKILYTKKRLKVFQELSKNTVILLLKKFHGKNPNVFIMASLKDDDSFTGLVLKNKRKNKLPSLLKGLTDPASYLRVNSIQDLVFYYDLNLIRFWLIIISNPTFLYSTNPSTLAVFLTHIESNWSKTKEMIQDFLNLSPPFQSDLVQKMLKRHLHNNFRERFECILGYNTPPWNVIFADLKSICCWDGGYVAPFIEEIRKYLPEDRFSIFPMYSMSTETIETVPVMDGSEFYYLPLAKDVLYEFLPENASNHVENLLSPWMLETGKTYSMIISDAYGLRRYQTNDIFLCKRKYKNLPDLRFLRRKGIEFSFTGEKLTGEQLSLCYEEIKLIHPEIFSRPMHLTLIPVVKTSEGIPGYYLILAPPGKIELEEFQLENLQHSFESILGNINDEFKSKRESKRLAPIKIKIIEYSRLASALDTKTVSTTDENLGAWESQFKLLPLYQKSWEQYGLQ